MASSDDAEAREGALERTLKSLTGLQVEHYRSMSPMRRFTAALTGVVAKPGFIVCLFAVVIVWIGANQAAAHFGLAPIDPFPFPRLQIAASLFAAFTALLIVATQRRDDELAQRRAQLTLQLAAMSEQKIAKVIELIEEQRRDSPSLQSRRDPEAEEMAAPSDPRQVLDRIVEAHEESLRTDDTPKK